MMKPMRLSRFSHKLLTIAGIVLVAGLVLWTLPASASGSGTITLSPASGSYTNGSNLTFTIHENSGAELVNVVESDLSYDASKLQFVSIDSSASPFDFAAQSNGGSGYVCITRAKIGSSYSGDQIVSSVTFKVISTGTTSLSLYAGANPCSNASTGSSLLRASDQVNVWNGVTSVGSFTLAAAVNPSPSPSPTPSPSPSPSPSPKSKSPSPSPSPTPSPSPSPSPTPSPSPSTTTTTPTVGTNSVGYIVNIKVEDSGGAAVTSAVVTLDGTKTANLFEGIAGFVGVTSGKHTIVVKANGQTKTSTITVTPATDTATIQDFPIRLAGASLITWPIIIISGLLLLGIVGVMIWLGMKPAGGATAVMAHPASPSPNPVTTPVVHPSAESPPSITPPAPEQPAAAPEIPAAPPPTIGQVVYPGQAAAEPNPNPTPKP